MYSLHLKDYPILSYEGAVGCSEAPGEQLGLQCLAQGHFDLQLMGRDGIEPMTLGLQDDPLIPLSYSHICVYIYIYIYIQIYICLWLHDTRAVPHDFFSFFFALCGISNEACQHNPAWRCDVSTLAVTCDPPDHFTVTVHLQRRHTSNLCLFKPPAGCSFSFLFNTQKTFSYTVLNSEKRRLHLGGGDVDASVCILWRLGDGWRRFTCIVYSALHCRSSKVRPAETWGACCHLLIHTDTCRFKAEAAFPCELWQVTFTCRALVCDYFKCCRVVFSFLYSIVDIPACISCSILALVLCVHSLHWRTFIKLTRLTF